MKKRALLFVAVLSVSGCAGTGPSNQTFSNRASVSHPEALFDVVERSRAVSRTSAGSGAPMGQRICPRADDVLDHHAMAASSLRAMSAAEPAYTTVPRDFARAVNISAFRLLMDHDTTRARSDIALLRRHAEADAWIHPSPNNAAAGAVIEALGPLLPAWHILRQSDVATEEDRRIINAWLVRLADVSAKHTASNNVATFRGANDMMLGLIVGDEARYARGYRTGFLPQLQAMRADGSFPEEVSRGDTALERTARNIALLVYMAEIAASQGVDLYSVSVDGKSVHDAIGFLIRANAANGVVDAYAKENVGGTGAFKPNAQKDPFANAARGWVLLYTKRFPDGDISKELLKLRPLDGRFSADTTGGYTSCFAGDLAFGKRR